MKRIAQLLFVLLITISCHRDPTEEPLAPYFEMDVTETYNTLSTDDWVIVHNEKGQIFGVAFFESSDHISFDSTVIPKNIGVTLVQVKIETGEFTVNTYLDQEVKSKWTLKKEIQSGSEGSYVGPLNVTVSDSNLGSIYNSNISSKSNMGIAPPATNGPEIVFAEQAAATEKKFLIFVTDKDGNPYYKILEPGVTGSHTYSLMDFAQYEKIISFNFPSSANYFVSANAFEAGQNTSQVSGYNTNLYWDGYFSGVAKSSLKLGFTNQFPLYRINAAANYSNYDLCYNYYGPTPTGNVQLTNDITASVTNTTFAGITITGNDYLWNKSFWRVMGTENQVGFVTVHSSNKASKNLQSIPLQITSKYPLVNIQNFVYTNSYLFKGTQTYPTFVAEEFKAKERKPYELKFKSVYQ